jgi:hypothetical protein
MGGGMASCFLTTWARGIVSLSLQVDDGGERFGSREKHTTPAFQDKTFSLEMLLRYLLDMSKIKTKKGLVGCFLGLEKSVATDTPRNSTGSRPGWFRSGLIFL